MNKREIGAAYEERAAEYLLAHGVRLLEQNYRTRSGEIDLIGRDGEYLVFFEVKYRRTDGRGAPAEAVDYRKQRTICRVADYYRMTHRIGDAEAVRYDVVAICGEELTWYRNAFEHIYVY
ncbi:MAG: YraN family protein [Roseburia sp.]|nr:YraN family protein [Roseburia sp.]